MSEGFSGSPWFEIFSSWILLLAILSAYVFVYFYFTDRMHELIKKRDEIAAFVNDVKLRVNDQVAAYKGQQTTTNDPQPTRIGITTIKIDDDDQKPIH